MGKINTDEVAKVAWAGGILTIIVSWLTGRMKSRFDELQTEVATLHDIIEEWKNMALAALNENKLLREEIVGLKIRVFELELINKK